MRTDRSIAVGLFEASGRAEQALQALRELGVSERQLGYVRPGSLVAAANGAQPRLSGVGLSGLLAGRATAGGDLAAVLVELGLPNGEARFYAREVQSGRSMVVVDAGQGHGGARDVLRRHGGYDVESEGRQLARGADGRRSSGTASPSPLMHPGRRLVRDGAPGGTGPRPLDVTGRWEDVRSRYQMLFEQHYGTTDVTWPEAEPLYRYAWETANAPAHRGQPWASVEGRLRREWEADSRSPAWPEVAGPIRDVWEDVAAEAARGAEGGAARRVARQGADQAGPASEVRTPRGPA
jgi:hypothetical protein